MPQTQEPRRNELALLFCLHRSSHTVFGGFVRLTRSGLSITEWNPIIGAVPPTSQKAWQDEFAKYQKSPEFIQVNSP